MCVIIVKPANVSLPSEQVLREAWQNNPDGGGYCFPTGTEVVGRKGYTDFDSIYEDLLNLPQELPIIIHFRIATHGRMDGTATHPFPITKNKRSLFAVKWNAAMGVAHNGVIPGYGQRKGNLSDTQEFIYKVLSNQTIKRNLFNNRAIQRLIRDATNSKWAFINKHGKTVLIGDFIKEDGIYFSNDSFRRAAYKYIACGWGITKHVSPEDLAPDNCPLAWGNGTELACLDCPYYNYKYGYCKLFEIENPVLKY